jgi:hypothetical protein
MRFRNRRDALALGVVFAGLLFVPAAGAQVLSVTPNSNLAQTASVDVSGSGYAPNEQGAIFEKSADESLVSGSVGVFHTTLGGTFGPVTVTVTRVFTALPGGQSADCYALGCLLSGELDQVPGKATAPIAFAPPGTPGVSGGGTTGPGTGTPTTTPGTHKKCKKGRVKRHGRCVKKKK